MKRVAQLLPSVAVLALLLSRGGAASADIIFSTFGSGDSFDPSRAYQVTNQPFPPVLIIDQAMAFMPLGSDFFIDRIELAVAATNSINRLPALDLSLAGDTDGVPGPMIETLHLSDVTLPGVYSVDSVDRPNLREGTRYWLIAQADMTTDAQWFFNSISEIGTVATRVAPTGAWAPTEAPQGAFRIEGTAAPVPEPSVLLLLGIAALGLTGCVGRHGKSTAKTRAFILVTGESGTDVRMGVE